MIRKTIVPVVAVLMTLFVAEVAWAGAIDDFIGTFVPDGATWWVSTIVGVSGLLSFLMAILPQGETGGAWDKVRTAINLIASNWGNAKNKVN